MPQTAPEIKVGTSFERRRHETLKLVLAPKAGRLAVSQAQFEALERRRDDELTSTLAEGLKGTVNTHYSFEMIDGQLVAEDGEPIEELLLRGLRTDIKLASEDGFFAFLPERSRTELDNFRLTQTMARGETHFNTLLEISPYNEELDTSQDKRDKLLRAAQKPYWGRTMIRLSHWDGQQLHIITMSSDNLAAAQDFTKSAATSSVGMFKEAVQEVFGYRFNAKSANQMLAEPVSFNIKDDSWRHLPGELTAEIDKRLAEHHGGDWQQGRPAGESVDLQKYVQSQAEILAGLRLADRRLVAQHGDFEDYQRAFEREIYNCLALLEKRLELGKTNEKIVDYQATSAGAGAMAQAEGKTYDACGLIISAQNTQSSTAEKTGFESLLRLENKKINCYACKKNVVVDKKYLEKGQLHCSQCGYHLDVCTGKSSYKKREKSPPQADQAFSAFEIISNWFKKMGREAEIKDMAQKQARAELGDNVTYLDVKRREKKIHQKLAA
ncbi:MAG: hypothetical protein Q7R60_03980 [bacterium]|nr:hypothetical protein [bacterium]